MIVQVRPYETAPIVSTKILELKEFFGHMAGSTRGSDVAIGAILANVPWGTLAEQAPRLLNGASRLVRSFRSRPDTHASEALTAGSSKDGTLEAIRILEEAVETLSADLQKTAILLEELAGSHAEMARELKRAYIMLIPTAVIAAGGILLAVFALLG